MLKEYFDRDSSISKPITVVNTVPQESNVFKPEVNSDFIDKSDPGPSKLENSDILRNLNNKLSHLEPSQQEELKQLNIYFLISPQELIKSIMMSLWKILNQ